MSESIRHYGKILSVIVIVLVILVIIGWRISRATTSIDQPLDPNTNSETVSSQDATVRILSENITELSDQRQQNRRVWNITREVETRNPVTEQSETEIVVSTVVEVGTGICYVDGSGQWAITHPQWRETLDGFVMDQAGYTLAIGRTLDSFLEYTVEQETLLLRAAAIKAMAGERLETLAPAQKQVQGHIDPEHPQRLVFSGAFGEGIDLVLVAEPDGFHQDVILHSFPMLPEGMTPDQTHIMVYTELALDNYCLEQNMGFVIGAEEWFVPGVSLNTTPTLEDIEFLKFIPQEDVIYGYNRHRFTTSKIYDASREGPTAKTAAFKQLFRDSDNTVYLIETLEGAFFEQAAYPVTWDYHTISGTFDPNEIWYANNTYYVSSNYTIADGFLTIEPGTIVKFADDTQLIAGTGGRIIARGDPYLPILFTSKHDNNNGQYITGTSGTPARDDWGGLVVNEGCEVEFCRVLYANPALDIQGVPAIPVRHNQFYKCKNGIDIDEDAVGEGQSLTLFNNHFTQLDENGITIHGDDGDVLVRNQFMGTMDKAIDIDSACTHTIAIENTMMLNCDYGLYHDPNYNVANITNDYNGYYNNAVANSYGLPLGAHSVELTTSPQHGVFSSYYELGWNYLNKEANGGELIKDAGSCTVAAAGYEDPCQWSIYHVPNDNVHGFYSDTTISTNTDWAPDYSTCDTGTVAIGYHYPRVDYLIDEVKVTVNGGGNPATLTIEPGTVIAHRSTTYDDYLDITSGDKITANGDLYTDNGMITWVECLRIGGVSGSLKYPFYYGYYCLRTNSADYELTANRFWGLGYAFYPYYSGGLVRDCRFSLNTNALLYYYTADGDDDICQNNLFSENYYGILDYATSELGPVSNCTFADNTYGLFCYNGSPEVINCLFHNNTYGMYGSTLAEEYNIFRYQSGQTARLSGDLDTTDWANPATNYAQTYSGELFPVEWTDYTDRFYLVEDCNAVNTGYDPDGRGMPGYTTSINNTLDVAPIDMGFHYPQLPRRDTDGDGLYDDQEHWSGTDYQDIDSDDDGLVDGDDGLILLRYYPGGLDVDGDGYVDGECDAGTDPADADSDDDGMLDGWETRWTATNPNASDAGNNTDGDGMTNYQEYTYYMQYNVDLSPDVNNEGDGGTINTYNAAGLVTQTRQYEVKGAEFLIRTETRSDYDKLGRPWRQRQLAQPGGEPDNLADAIELTDYTVDGGVAAVAQKAPYNPDPNDYYETYFTEAPNDPNFDAGDLIVSFTYDELGRRETVTDPLGQDTVFSYYDSGELYQITDPNGNITTYAYNEAGQVERITDAEGHYQISQYNSLGQVIVRQNFDVADTPLLQMRLEYDGLGNLQREAVMADAAELLTSAIVTTRDKVTDYVYDGSTGDTPGKLASRTIYYGGNPGSSATTTYDYDDLGRLEKTTDELDNEERLVYDDDGRITRRQLFEKNSVSGGTNLTITTDSIYDSHGYLTQQIDKPANPDAGSDASWRVTTFEYDGLGHRITMTNPENNVTSYSYDGLGRLVTQVADAGVGGIAQTTVYGYDRLGRQTSITGYADGATAQTTLYVYDRLGRVVWVMYPDVQFLHFGYNEGGKVIERTDQMDNKTTYSYDQMGRMETREYFSVAGYYVHDPNDPGSNPLLDGTPLYANDPNVIESFSYDGLGRMLTAVKTQEGSAVSNTEYDYNDLGPMELIEETHFGGTTQQIVCGYDQWGNLDELTYPDDSSITLTADAQGRIATINRSATTLVNYNYVGNRVSRRIYPVGGNDDVIYDISYNNSGWATRHYTYQGATVIADFGYDHDDNGNITEIAYNHRTSDPCQVYGYDDLDRLTMATYIGGEGEQFNYDKVGNRVSVTLRDTSTETYAVNNLTNQYNASGTYDIVQAYDDAGNTIEDHRGYTYQYDYENRLIEVADPNETLIAEFAYDALGRRIRKIDHAADVTTLYYYKDWQVLTEVADDGEDEITHDYVYGNYLDEVLLRTTEGTTDVYLAHDHLFSPVALLDATGAVQERYEYDSYGKRSVYNSGFNARSSSNYDLTIAFTGQRLDNLDNGDRPLGYYKKRYYDPETGRFLTRDPLDSSPSGLPENDDLHIQRQYIKSMNLYEYVESKPVINLDMYGLLSKKCCELLLRERWLSDPSITDLYQKANTAYDGNGKKCLKKIECADNCPSNRDGAYYPKKRKIVICAYDGQTTASMRETLRHELLHAIQCDASYNCSHCMRKEMEAYYHSGGCNTEERCLRRSMQSCSSICVGKNWWDYLGRWPFPPDMPVPPHTRNPRPPKPPSYPRGIPPFLY